MIELAILQYAQGQEICQLKAQTEFLNRFVIPNKLRTLPGGLHENFRLNSARVSDSRVEPQLF